MSFMPNIVGFACQWCTYAGADLAGNLRAKYPPSIKLIKVPCSGRVEPEYILEALANGADGAAGADGADDGEAAEPRLDEDATAHPDSAAENAQTRPDATP